MSSCNSRISPSSNAQLTEPFSQERVDNMELIARFVVRKEWVRADNTVRPDAFVPPQDLNLSVTRHISLSIEDLWNRGLVFAETQAKALLGRIDAAAENIRAARQPDIDVVPHPILGNPQHAHIVGWPSTKPEQKLIAQRISAQSVFVQPPEPSA